MEFSYYDLLSRIIVGYFTLIASFYAFGINYNEQHSIAYIAAAFVIGYFLNAISSIFENFWFWTIGGKPSDKLLTINPKKKYTGISKVRLYDTQQIINKLKKETNSKAPTTQELFSMQKGNVMEIKIAVYLYLVRNMHFQEFYSPHLRL